jgi:hypothetical protein
MSDSRAKRSEQNTTEELRARLREVAEQ